VLFHFPCRWKTSVHWSCQYCPDRTTFGWLLFLLLFPLPFLVACGHTPVTRTLADAFDKGTPVAGIPLNPDFRYLRVATGGREALMVLGYVDADPDPDARGAVETWYSREGEVLRLQDGRILSTTGLRVDWRAVRYAEVPTWTQMLTQDSAVFVRERDEMPGYRFNLKDSVYLYTIQPPGNAHLVGIPADHLRWYEERVLGAPRNLPSARYGVRLRDPEGLAGVEGAGAAVEVVYGEQCLALDLCVAWQTWPVLP
jgi:hypothetical protein